LAGFGKRCQTQALRFKKAAIFAASTKNPCIWGFSAFDPALLIQGYQWGGYLNKLVLTNLNPNPKLAQSLHSPI
jgi:hypothetical protein